MSEIKVNSVVNSTGDNDSGLDLSTNVQVIIKTANTTAITVDSSQKVGIGTNSPQLPIHVKGGFPSFVLERDAGTGGATGLVMTNSTTNGIYQSGSDETFTVGHVTDYDGSPSYTERMRIDSSGKLLINTTSTLGVGQGVLHLKGATDNTVCVVQVASNGERGLDFRNTSGTEVGSVTVGASSTSYNTSSDYRLKENVDYTFDATTRLKQLKPARFNFIADADTTVDGFLAHEVQSVVPEAITGTHNEVDDDGNAVMQGIDQSKLVPLLVKTIQELEARITVLENGE